jgi:predicted ribosomally synthesized peptide with SipW-like signal peptide
MKKILVSVSIIAAAAAIVVGATTAFFSDTESSVGNTFTAGSIDLKVDNECHWSGGATCPWHDVQGQLANWTENDLQTGVHKFFNFADIKPGDSGEDTISLHVINNDAWGRLVISGPGYTGQVPTPVTDTDNGCTEPELNPVDPQCPDVSSQGGVGELRQNLLFNVWLDQGVIPGFQGKTGDPTEGDNVFDSGDVPLITSGPIDAGGEVWDLADGLALAAAQYPGAPGLNSDGHLTGSVTYYFGVGWQLPQIVGNDVQSDTFGGDMILEVSQYRNQGNPY